MDAQQIRDAFDDVFDQALVFHGFADHMRDYDVFVYATADPRTGIRPSHLRYRFTHCVRATTTTSLPPETWARSLDDRLLDHDTGHDLDGYVWGVRWQELYPGMRLVPPTADTGSGGPASASRSTRPSSRPTARRSHSPSPTWWSNAWHPA